MQGEFVSIPAEGGAAFGAYCLSDARGPAPGIVMLTEIFGITAEMRTEAAIWAEAGFAVLVPDPFWRQQPRAVLGYEGADRARAFELYTKFDHEAGAADAGHAAAALRQSPACNGRVAVIGYCFGGTLAWMAAARANPDAAVSFYGTQIHRHLGDAQRTKCPVSLHLGDRDAHVPPEAVAATRDAIAGRPGIEFYLYPGIGHAFMNPARPTFDAAAAELARKRTIDFLGRAMRHLAA